MLRQYFSIRNTLLLALSLACSALQAEEVTVKQADTTLRGELTLAKDKTLKDGVVLMLHGTLAHNNMEIMQTVADLLKDKGYNSLRVNLSYGLDKRASTMLDCGIEHRHKHEDALNELETWLNWLKQQGVSKVALFGHSRGGNQIAWYVAEKTPELLDTIILVAPATWDAKQTASDYQERYKQPLAPLMAEAEKSSQAGKAHNLMTLPGFVYCENAKASAEAVLSYYRDDARKNTPSLLGKMTKPVLVVVGSEDKVVADLARQLADIKQETLKVTTIEGADHFFLDLYADELADKTTEFLAW